MVEKMGREVNHITKRIGDMATRHVGVVPLNIGNGVMSLLYVVSNKLEAICSRSVGGVNDHS